jgi:IBR domain, a half RING-finger domain
MAKSKSTKTPTKNPKLPQAIGKRKRPEVQTKECVICVENKPLYRNFPAFTSCSHDPGTCSSCVAKQTVTLLEASSGTGWSSCRCPQCDAPIPTEELQNTLPRALVKEMRGLVDKALQSTDDSWRWCLATGCGHGGLQNGLNEMIRCRKCDYRMCFKHQVPWHTGYSCQEYETSHPEAAVTKTNEEMIRKMSKPCPGCGIAVQKDGGCNNMSCECLPCHAICIFCVHRLMVCRPEMWCRLALGQRSIRRRPSRASCHWRKCPFGCDPPTGDPQQPSTPTSYQYELKFGLNHHV